MHSKALPAEGARARLRGAACRDRRALRADDPDLRHHGRDHRRSDRPECAAWYLHQFRQSARSCAASRCRPASSRRRPARKRHFPCCAPAVTGSALRSPPALEAGRLGATGWPRPPRRFFWPNSRRRRDRARGLRRAYVRPAAQPRTDERGARVILRACRTAPGLRLPRAGGRAAGPARPRAAGRRRGASTLEVWALPARAVRRLHRRRAVAALHRHGGAWKTARRSRASSARAQGLSGGRHHRLRRLARLSRRRRTSAEEAVACAAIPDHRRVAACASDEARIPRRVAAKSAPPAASRLLLRRRPSCRRRR